MNMPEALAGPYTALDVTLDGGVAVILLANPPVNALSTDMMNELSWVLDRISERRAAITSKFPFYSSTYTLPRGPPRWHASCTPRRRCQGAMPTCPTPRRMY